MGATKQSESLQLVERDLSTRFTSSLALPSHDEAGSPALLLSQDEHRQALPAFAAETLGAYPVSTYGFVITIVYCHLL